ncbi:MAG: LPS-assembly protein LptD [Cypionkella sp.]
MLRRLVLIIALMTLSAPVLAQDKASLIADGVRISGNDTLVAEGHVEIFYQGKTLSASRIVYDQANDRLLIDGPISLSDGSGSYILASQAEMSADLTEGVLRSARLVLEQQLQLAAASLRRVDGRYTALNKVVASSCKICRGSATPLWEIRSKRVVHDQQEQQLYFDQAQFRLGGVPIFYIPRLRMPDPSLQRATGFLMPTLRSNTNFGTGLRLPYFIKIGDDRDLTLTPFFTTKGTQTLEFRYRQAFATGRLDFTGSVTRDDLLADKTRGYLLAAGNFNLPEGFNLALRGEVVSDPAYLADYDYDSTDRLDSRVVISRVRRNEYISGRLIGFHSIREGDDNATLPSVVADLTFARRFSLGALGGMGKFQIQAHAHRRSSSEDLADVNMDGIADGRDMRRLSVRADWRRNFQLGAGIQGAILGETAADFYAISQDQAYEGSKTRLQGAVAAELRWPWVKSEGNGVSHLIEPVAQLVLASTGKSTIPNEDSALVEFDEGNLFALSRFPGSDAVENGMRANLGINYLRSDPDGWTLGVTAGRVVRAEDPNLFSEGSGLAGLRSNWLAAWQLDMKNVAVTNRLLFDDQFNVTKAELGASYTLDRFALATNYVHTVADPSEARFDPIRELTLASSFQFNDNWTGRLGSRYDFESERTAKASAGVTFRNECLLVDLSLSRRFTSSTSVAPTTDFGLAVELLGFGGGSAAGPARQCRR